MKKILSLGVAAAVLSVTAVAASAAIAPTIITDAVAGEEITVEIVATGVATNAAQFNVVASDNLTLVDAVATTNGFAAFNNNKFAWANTAAPADGDVLLTLTYAVDAAADEEISIALTPDAGFEADVDGTAAVAVVVGGEETVVDPVESEEIIDTVDTSDVIIDTAETPAETEDTADTSDETENVPTGIALAVVPAILAGAAIVVAKKRS